MNTRSLLRYLRVKLNVRNWKMFKFAYRELISSIVQIVKLKNFEKLNVAGT